jgi:hypothetical protein
MKKIQFLLGIFLLVSAAHGNVYIPKAKLAGETVYVQLTKDSARVTAVFEFEQLQTKDGLIVYFPIFSNAADDPIRVLADSRFELSVGDKTVNFAKPCPAPEWTKDIKTDHRICWFTANIGDLIFYQDDKSVVVETNESTVIRFSYTQPLIHGRFYYLPVIPGASVPDWDWNKNRYSWNYQMFARSGLRVTDVSSKGTLYEPLEDSVVVYLKDREIVEIQ